MGNGERRVGSKARSCWRKVRQNIWGVEGGNVPGTDGTVLDLEVFMGQRVEPTGQ